MNDQVIMTLDAGGTNFVFSAICNAAEVVKPVHMSAMGHDLDQCLKNIISGFEAVKEKLTDPPAAISFAFPGPADYENGIIDDLENLPGFRGGVALGPMLENHFGLPVFINNDGDLFVFGEAMHGLLPDLNKRLRDAGSPKQFKNLSGVTLGTGFGGGFFRNTQLMAGDNGAAGEVWLMQNPLISDSFAEESISARAIVNEYASLSGNGGTAMTPADVYLIAKGEKVGNREAALESFRKFGSALGMVLAEISTIMDAPVVIGGGLSNAWELFSAQMFREMEGSYTSLNGKKMPRLIMKTFNLEDPLEFSEFAKGSKKSIHVPFSGETINYDPMKRIGVGLSRLGASKAIALGAYAFAINKLAAN